MRETTSREFAEWLEFFELDLKYPRREEFYLAQVAMEVRKSTAKYPHKVKLEDGLLTLTVKGGTNPKSEADKKRQIANSKARWFAFTKMTPAKKD